MTVIETCRHSKDGLQKLLKKSKSEFDEIYDKDIFSTESSSGLD